jgi:hypothetical protein
MLYGLMVKKISFIEMKQQEARSRMAAVRKARRSPQAAAEQQRRASLVGNGAKWRITNIKQVGPRHCQMGIVHWRFLINRLEEETDCGALTGRLSCGHSETRADKSPRTHLYGGALNGCSGTTLHSAVGRSCHSRPAPFRFRFQNARSVLQHLHIST